MHFIFHYSQATVIVYIHVMNDLTSLPEWPSNVVKPILYQYFPNASCYYTRRVEKKTKTRLPTAPSMHNIMTDDQSKIKRFDNSKKCVILLRVSTLFEKIWTEKVAILCNNTRRRLQHRSSCRFTIIVHSADVYKSFHCVILFLFVRA